MPDRTVLPDSPAALLGRRVRQLREAAGYSLAELATRAGLSKMGLAKLEWGQRWPRPETLAALAGPLRVSVGDLLGYGIRKIPKKSNKKT